MSGKKNEKKIDVGQLLKDYGIIVVLILLVIFISALKPQFLSMTNLLNVLNQTAIYGIMALGVTLVIIAKGIDLSLGSMLAVAGVVAASLGQSENAQNKFFESFGELPVIVPILAALAVGAACGLLSGFFVAKTRIPAFIATLGMTTILRGLALLYTNGKPITGLSSGVVFLGSKIGVIPVPIIIYGIVILITWVLLNYTRFGSDAYAIGGNIHAAEVSGVNISRAQIKIFGYCGLLCGIAAIVFAGRVQSVHPGAAEGYELTAIAATTIGGTSQSGGIGTIWGAVIGALVLSVLRNGLTLLGVHAYWQQIVEGAIIIGAVIIDMRKNAVKA